MAKSPFDQSDVLDTLPFSTFNQREKQEQKDHDKCWCVEGGAWRRPNGGDGRDRPCDFSHHRIGKERQQDERCEARIANEDHKQQHSENELYCTPLMEDGNDVATASNADVNASNALRPAISRKEMNAAPHNDRQQDEQREGPNKTHPSICVWVLGEEATKVELHDATLAYVD
jgi:hypothetical protein